MADFQKSARLQALPRYLFAELERKRAEAEAAGREVLDVSIGDPDLPTPPAILDRLAEASRDARNHRYPTSAGMPDVRAAIARWFEKRFGVALDPNREVAILIGSKEGIGHFPLAALNPGDEALVPDPGYPVYAAGTVFAGATPVRFPLREKDGFVPDPATLDRLVTPRTRLVFVNYPNNPTGATAPAAFYAELSAWATKHGL
jgi:LL-diaminopimelate aminotransferase